MSLSMKSASAALVYHRHSKRQVLTGMRRMLGMREQGTHMRVVRTRTRTRAHVHQALTLYKSEKTPPIEPTAVVVNESRPGVALLLSLVFNIQFLSFKY